MSFGGSVLGAIVSLRNNRALKNHRRNHFFKRKNEDILKPDTYSSKFQFKTYTSDEKREMQKRVRVQIYKERAIAVAKAIGIFVIMVGVVFAVIKILYPL